MLANIYSLDLLKFKLLPLNTVSINDGTMCELWDHRVYSKLHVPTQTGYE